MIIKNGIRSIYGVLNRPVADSDKPLPLVIISHGFNGSHNYGKNYFEPLANIGYQTFTFDFPCGSTRSTLDNNTVNMSINDEVSDLTFIVNYFSNKGYVDPEHITLIGESQGGMVSCLAASSISDSIERLILCFPAFCIPDNYNDRFREAIPDTTYVWGVPLGRRYFEELRTMNAYDVMPRFRKPVLIIHGDKDPIVPLHYSEHALQFYPDVTLKVIEGAGHGFKDNEFKLSMSYITSFLSGNDKLTCGE
ncbi:MAG: alpha/beta hydrolase [Clostridiales bacterium]|nr:alpha/beta hydrolase [Clostridiales bacterium]